ncbi:phosphatidylethanolamine-binding protein [Thamnocephalis sphaerospora]|uniref:Phosphatidylethanolamine-binding protein n=1 Tax=Thamnocephalis sphaerospora TaxID=78915 RepID=A0A4V1IW53_9FUNG|nr:phosphatidylethanolamine-binding protein [Thamnocephalis sphaerospora]|eukprot:RKP06359.1 phosphatidylethanolamine-binding protein [Thamnocephalis sphaerospora]
MFASVRAHAPRLSRSLLARQIRHNASAAASAATSDAAYQEAVKVLRAHRDEKLAKVKAFEERLKKLDSTAADKQRKHLEKHIYKLRVQAEQDQPETLARVESGDIDLTVPVFRHLRERIWREGVRETLLERITQMYVLPDVLPPSMSPVMDVHLEFADPADAATPVRFTHGDILPTTLVAQAPQVHAQCFHDETRLYTLMMVDPDDPCPAERTYRTRCHWLVANVPFHLTQSTMAEGAGETVLAYEAPLPTKGTKRHRYTLLVLEQAAGGQERMTIQAEALSDRIVDVTSFLQQHQLTPRGITFFRSEWDEAVDQLYPQVHGVRAPVYGRAPKLDPVRDAALIQRLMA